MITNINQFQKYKQEQKKITMVTCYDATFAKIIAQSSIDTILIGDSVAMVVHGHESTIPATVSMMSLHTSAVTRANPKQFIVSDMPFLSVRKGLKYATSAAGELLKSGANAVKIEGIKGHEKIISHLVESGIPVMGHLGLTPQSVHQLGGHIVQGKNKEDHKRVLDEAFALEKLGVFAIVLECMPKELAKDISKSLKIPTIGIGAGPDTDGQVLVLQDMLGFNHDFNPKFLKKYLNGSEATIQALNQYDLEVKKSFFPSLKESY